MSTSQPAAQSIGIHDVSGGTIIGAGVSGTGNIVGKDVRLEGPVIYIHNISEEGARTLRDILRIPTDAPAAPAPAGVATTGVRSGIDEMLRLMKSAAAQGIRALQVDTAHGQFSAVDLLLRKAVLLVAEANALTVAETTPEKAEVARRMDQGALGEMLAGHDGPQARALLAEALEVLQEARRLAPDSTAVMLQMAQLLGRTGSDTAEERELLDEVMRRVGTAWTEEQRLHRAQAMYLLGTLGRNRDVDLLRGAREHFVRLARVDWMRQCDQALAAAESLPRRDRRPVRVPQPLSLGRVVRRVCWIVGGLFFGGFALKFVVVLLALAAQANVPQQGVTQQSVTSAPAAFDPAGDWAIRFASGTGTTLNLRLMPGGAIDGSVDLGNAGTAALGGRWEFDADSRVLAFDLTGNGAALGAVGFQVTELLADGFAAMGTDGNAYRFTRR